MISPRSRRDLAAISLCACRYVDDEVAHLMRMLREGGEPIPDAEREGEGREGNDNYDESESFDLNAVLTLAREFAASFEELLDEDGDVGDREEL